MKFKLPITHLKNALARLSGIPGAQPTIIHTQAVKFECDLAGLKLSRFTSEAKISIILESAEIENDGAEFCVDHASITRCLSGLPDGEIVCDSNEKEMAYSIRKSKGKIKVFAELDGEPPEDENDRQEISIAIGYLRALMAFPYAARSNDNSANANLCSICVRMMNERLAFIGSDRKRCHIAYADELMDVDCVIAANGVSFIQKALAGEDGNCAFAIGESKVSVIAPSVEITLSLMAEKFPDVSQVLKRDPETIESKIVADKGELKDALDEVSGIAEGDSKMVICEFTKKSMSISATGKDINHNTSVSCKSTAVGKINIPAVQLAESLGMMSADNEGMIEIVQYQPVIIIQQPDMTAFMALSKV